MPHKYSIIFLFFLLTATLPFGASGQIPQKVFEITNLLVDGCDGSNEGRNEMVLLQVGPDTIDISDLRVDGAGSTGVIIPNKWPNTNNPWRGFAPPPAKPLEIAAINSTIVNCGYLIEPPGGILLPGKKVLIITSTEFNPAAHSFATLGDTLYVLFQNAGNTSGHFVNYGTPSSLRTLVLVHVPSGGADTVVYDRSLLVTQSGVPGAQDGGSVKYTWSGAATYYNNGCQAPYTPLSAAWTCPPSICETAPPLDLGTLITGSTGGYWTGTGVSGYMFYPSGLSGSIELIYTVGSPPCTVADTQSIQILPAPDASWTAPGPLCQSSPPIILDSLVTGTPGGTWIGNGISGNVFSPAGLSGYITITYSTGTPPCAGNETHAIQVIPDADAGWNSPGLICLGSPAVNLSAYITGDAGGIWSGTGITNSLTGMFDPAVAGAGNWQITYIHSSACGDTVTHSITVAATADATVNPAGPYCEDDPPATLTAADPGGTWSGNGITDSINGVFNPANAGAGNHLITYIIPGSCGDTGSITIIVYDSPDASILSTGPYCDNLPAFNLSAASPGGVWTGNGITNINAGTFDPGGAGEGDHQITYEISGPCGSSDTALITVLPSPVFTLTSSGESCAGAADGTATVVISGDSSMMSYLWSNGAVAPEISGLAPGQYNVVVSGDNACSAAGNVSVQASDTPCEIIIPVIYVPNVFSPNGDNINDVLYVRGQGIVSLTFFIYDRWGEKVFETTDPANGWDGVFRGQDMGEDVYFYYLSAELTNGERITRKGSVSVVR